MNTPINFQRWQQDVSRRSFLERSAYGLGGLALRTFCQALRRQGRPDAELRHGVLTQPHVPIKARRVIHLCMAGGPSQFETLDWKPAQEAGWQALPRFADQGSAACAASEQETDRSRPLHHVPKVWQERTRDFQRAAAPGHDCRRGLHRPFDGDRTDQPRSGPGIHEQRLDPQGTAEHGLVAALRIGRRDREPPRIRGDRLQDQGRRHPASVGAPVGERGFCPADFRACCFNREAMRSITSAIPMACARACSAWLSTRSSG